MKRLTDILKDVSLGEAKATMCGRCGTKHVPPAQGGKCPAVSEEVQVDEAANVRAGNPKAYGNDLAASQTGFNKKPREDDEYHNDPKPKFKAKSLMDRPHDVHIDGKKWKSFNNGHQAHAAVNTLKAKGKKATAIARFSEEVEVNELKDSTLKNYIRSSSGDVINRQNIANRTGMTDRVRAIIKKRNQGQEAAQRKLSEDACHVCGQTPCNCTHIEESSDKLYSGFQADVLKLKQKAAEQEKKNPVDIKKLAARLRAVKLPGDKK